MFCVYTIMINDCFVFLRLSHIENLRVLFLVTASGMEKGKGAKECAASKSFLIMKATTLQICTIPFAP